MDSCHWTTKEVPDPVLDLSCVTYLTTHLFGCPRLSWGRGAGSQCKYVSKQVTAVGTRNPVLLGPPDHHADLPQPVPPKGQGSLSIATNSNLSICGLLLGWGIATPWHLHTVLLLGPGAPVARQSPGADSGLWEQAKDANRWVCRVS